jgi:hypothetical protein
MSKFVVYVSNAPGHKSGLSVKTTEADARGQVHELCIALKPKGSKEYNYQEISFPVCALARAMKDNPEKDPRYQMSRLTSEQLAELDLLLEAQERAVV